MEIMCGKKLLYPPEFLSWLNRHPDPIANTGTTLVQAGNVNHPIPDEVSGLSQKRQFIKSMH